MLLHVIATARSVDTPADARARPQRRDERAVTRSLDIVQDRAVADSATSTTRSSLAGLSPAPTEIQPVSNGWPPLDG